MAAIRGIVFDKDGTLFDFRATWGVWSCRLVAELAQDSGADRDRLFRAIGYDPRTGHFDPDSPVIAHTPDEIAEVLLPWLPGADPAALAARMNALAALTEQAPAVPLVPLFSRLAQGGLHLGLATNDGEAPARAHLERAGIAPFFGFVAGYDSGHGAKPAPGPLLAFAAAAGLAPDAVLMVGDSRHDMIAGRAAGMRTVAVLTGLAGASDLAPLAEAVLPDIGHLPGWLDTAGAGAPGAYSRS